MIIIYVPWLEHSIELGAMDDGDIILQISGIFTCNTNSTGKTILRKSFKKIGALEVKEILYVVNAPLVLFSGSAKK